MGKRDSITPSVLVGKIRENQNNNKTLKALFASQFLGKFSTDELEAFKKSINKEIDGRKQKEINVKIAELVAMGYKVSK